MTDIRLYVCVTSIIHRGLRAAKLTISSATELRLFEAASLLKREQSLLNSVRTNKVATGMASSKTSSHKCCP